MKANIDAIKLREIISLWNGCKNPPSITPIIIAKIEKNSGTFILAEKYGYAITIMMVDNRKSFRTISP